MGCLYSQFGAIEFQQGHEIYRRLQKQHLLQLTNPAIIRSAVPLKVNTGLQQGGWDCRSYSKGAGTTGPPSPTDCGTLYLALAIVLLTILLPLQPFNLSTPSTLLQVLEDLDLSVEAETADDVDDISLNQSLSDSKTMSELKDLCSPTPSNQTSKTLSHR